MTAIAFERQLAMHCAPALVGIKPANIVTFPVKDGEEGMRPGELAAAYNRRFQGRDLRFRILRECPRRRLLMVYRPSKLERHLRRPEVRQILASEGYREAELEELLGQLEERVRRSGSCDFPHEIGLFLGYPVEDVVGFMENCGKKLSLLLLLEGVLRCGQGQGLVQPLGARQGRDAEGGGLRKENL